MKYQKIECQVFLYTIVINMCTEILTWALYSKVSCAITSIKGQTEVFGSSAIGSRRGGSQLTFTWFDWNCKLGWNYT